MPIELSGTDIALFTISVGAFMTFHGWFFITTTVKGDRRAQTEAQQEALLARLEAVQQGRLIELDDHRKAQAIGASEE